MALDRSWKDEKAITLDRSDDMTHAPHDSEADSDAVKKTGSDAVRKTGSDAVKKVASLDDFVEFEHANLESDCERLKDAVRRMKSEKNIVRVKTVNVYHDTGWAQYIARNQYFENGTLAVVVLNSIWLGIDADYNNAADLYNANLVFQIMENLFCSVFTCELLVRFMAYRTKVLALYDKWFLFDSLLVFIMIIETWVLTIYAAATGESAVFGANTSSLRLLRLARLLRMARIVRLLRIFPELLIFIRSLVAACRSMGYSMMILVLMMYMFAIIFTNVLEGTQAGDTYFPSVPRSMNSLMCYGTFYENLEDVLNILMKEGTQYYLLFLLYTCVASLVPINLLVSVLSEVASDTSARERDAIKVDAVRDMIIDLQKSRQDVAPVAGLEGEEMVSKHDIETMMSESPRLIHAFGEIQLDAVMLFDLLEDFFIDGDLPIDSFMDYIEQLRTTDAGVRKEICDIKRILLATMEEKEKEKEEEVEEEEEEEHADVMPAPPRVPLPPICPQVDVPDWQNIRNQQVQVAYPPTRAFSPFSPLAKAVADIHKQVTRSMLIVTSNMKSLEERIIRLEKFIVCEVALGNHLA